jgi:hypothetical protein
MKRVTFLRGGLASVAVLGMAGCYHATIDTGLAPSGQVIERPWAHGFIAGLVPPSVVETASRCPHGVAKVETKLSFLNQVANIVTLGIYTPMSIRVECAAQRTSSLSEAGANVFAVPEGAGAAELARVLGEAAEYSERTAAPAYVVLSSAAE